MCFVEALCANEVFTFEEPRFLTKDFGTDVSSESIIYGVPNNGSDGEEEDESERVQSPESGDGTGSKEEGVSGEEGGNDEAGFAEDNEEEEGVRPGTIGGNDALKVDVKIKEEVKELRHGGGGTVVKCLHGEVYTQRVHCYP